MPKKLLPWQMQVNFEAELLDPELEQIINDFRSKIMELDKRIEDSQNVKNTIALCQQRCIYLARFEFICGTFAQPFQL